MYCVMKIIIICRTAFPTGFRNGEQGLLTSVLDHNTLKIYISQEETGL